MFYNFFINLKAENEIQMCKTQKLPWKNWKTWKV